MLEIHLIETVHRDRQQEIERKLEVRRLLQKSTVSTVPAREDRVPDRSSPCVSSSRSAAAGR